MKPLKRKRHGCPRCLGDGMRACACARWQAGRCAGSHDCQECRGQGYITCRACNGSKRFEALEGVPYYVLESADLDAEFFIEPYSEGSHVAMDPPLHGLWVRWDSANRLVEALHKIASVGCQQVAGSCLDKNRPEGERCVVCIATRALQALRGDHEPTKED